jgi:hypothetical protein
VAIEPGRRRALVAIKLAALVREHAGEQSVIAPTTTAYEAGAAVIRTDGVWVFVDHDPARGLGGAIVWARRQSESLPLHVVVDDRAVASVLTRRAAAFSCQLTVWWADERTLRTVEPAPYPAALNVEPRLLGLAADILAGGADVVVEHGVLAGEVRGLEVCRAVLDPYLDVVRLEVGVGAHDREAFQMLHGDRPTIDSLRRIVDTVKSHREPGASPHPLNRLGAERAVRDAIVATPSLVGAATLVVADPPVPRPNLKDPVPCVATGVDVDGEPMVVVCSTGVDLDVVPFAADARGFHGGHLVIALPERDAYPATRSLLGLLREPAGLVTLAN